MAHTILDLEALLRVPYVDPDGAFDLSPDGTQVAFSHNTSGQWEVYLAPLDGSSPPRRVTGGPGSKSNPRWWPDGRSLGYTLDLTGGEAFDLWRCDLTDGQHTNLTPDTPDAIQPHYAISPDGARVAFISDRSGHFDTYVMPASGGPARPVFSAPHPDAEVYWSPDGQWLAIVSASSGQDSETFIVPADRGDARPIADGSTPLHAVSPRWSPDGRFIAFAAPRDGYFNLGLYEPATGRVTWLTEGPGDKDLPAWSPNGQRLAFVLSHGPVTTLAVLDVAQATLTRYQVEPGVHHQPRFTPDGTGLVFPFDSPRRPCDLWRLSLTDGSLQPLTRSLPPGFAETPFAVPEEVRYPSLDGRDVPALLYRPRPTGALPPAVIHIHGGPTWLSQFTWDPLIQHMVSRGWVVLAPNYRGSTGYGREWQTANRFDLGGGDTADVVAGADYLARAGLADPSRIAVTGESFGGYLTMTSLTGYPDRWAAGSAVIPFLNWFSEAQEERADLQHWDRENFGDPEKDRQRFYERSPFFFLDRITAPVQLICGANDPRCPASESLQARDRLVALGKPCELVLYNDEGHGFLKTENLVDAERRRVVFLAAALER